VSDRVIKKTKMFQVFLRHSVHLLSVFLVGKVDSFRFASRNVTFDGQQSGVIKYKYGTGL